MKAGDVVDALRTRYPDDRYCTVVEAPLDAGRQGTKIDVLAIGLWSSLRYELDAIEVKVSLSDFRREIERRTWHVVDANDVELTTVDTRKRATEYADADSWLADAFEAHHPVDRHPRPWTVHRRVESDQSKSEAWRAVAHRFWIAAPTTLALKIDPLLPTGWGLYACSSNGTHVMRRAAVNRDARPLSWRESIGLIRASADAGAACRARAFDAGARAAWQRFAPDDQPSQGTLWNLAGRPL